MPNLGAVAAGATAVAGIVRTLTDPEMVARINGFLQSVRERPKANDAVSLHERAVGLGRQLESLRPMVDNADETEQLVSLELRLRRIIASIPAADLASGGRKRKLLHGVGKALDQVTKDVIVLLVGEAVEEEPAARRPRLRAIRGRRR